jgi:hypothetical protein
MNEPLTGVASVNADVPTGVSSQRERPFRDGVSPIAAALADGVASMNDDDDTGVETAPLASSQFDALRSGVASQRDRFGVSPMAIEFESNGVTDDAAADDDEEAGCDSRAGVSHRERFEGRGAAAADEAGAFVDEALLDDEMAVPFPFVPRVSSSQSEVEVLREPGLSTFDSASDDAPDLSLLLAFCAASSSFRLCVPISPPFSNFT